MGRARPIERALYDALACLDAAREVDERSLARRHGATPEELRDLLDLDARASGIAALDGSLAGFRVLRALGEGGMGRVLLAVDELRSRRVALKLVRPELARSANVRRRFLREASAASRVRHPRVVRLFEARMVRTAAGRAPLLVMEYARGRTLRRLLDSGGALREPACRRVALETAQALAAVHAAGIVHRDVKPANLMIRPARGVKLLDLGMSLLLDESSRLTRTGRFVGTLAYAAPEQFDPALGAIDGRADLYALGVTLFECATGRLPWGDATEARVADGACGVSREFGDLVASLMRSRPADRPATAEEIVLALGRRGAVLGRAKTTGTVAPRVERAWSAVEPLARAALRGTGGVVFIAARRAADSARMLRECVGRLTTDPTRWRAFQGGWDRGSDGSGARACHASLGFVETTARGPAVLVALERCDLAEPFERAAIGALAAAAAGRPLVVLASVAPTLGPRQFGELAALPGVSWLDLDRPPR